MNIGLLLFAGLMVLGVLCGISMLRGDLDVPPDPQPGHVFQRVSREDRAAYVKAMRGLMAVQFRDLGRAEAKAGRELARALHLRG